MDNIQKLKETILKEYPRLTESDRFSFECGFHLECFNKCCADVNIFLTPYDVLRLRKALKMSSAEFLGKHTIIPFDKNQKFPVPLLLMSETEEKVCSFVDPEKGCTVYGSRPWPCRMYPLGMASPGDDAGENNKEFYFIMKEDVCLGIGRPKEWTVSEWIEDQGIREYSEFGELFKEVTLHKVAAGDWKPSAKQVEMYWMTLYDLDQFRNFVFESTFLQRFIVSEDDQQKLRNDDEELLKFGFKWIKMSLFGERTVDIRPDTEQKFRKTTE